VQAELLSASLLSCKKIASALMQPPQSGLGRTSIDISVHIPFITAHLLDVRPNKQPIF